MQDDLKFVSAYKHFSERLAERYNLFLTIEEWHQLSNSDESITICTISQRRKAVLITFKNWIILAIKSKTNNSPKLLTALPLSDCKYLRKFKREIEASYFFETTQEQNTRKQIREFAKQATQFTI